MKPSLDDELIISLGLEQGVVALIGAGGKKSTMYAAAALHPGRIALTSTSHMYEYDADRVDQVIRVEPESSSFSSNGRVVAFAGKTDTEKRVGGLVDRQIQELSDAGGFDLILVKADGARARWIKAPADYEPIVPANTDTVISVVSIGVVGRTLDDGIAHRPERIAAVTGATLGDPLSTNTVGKLLASPFGGLKGVGDARVVALINMVDDATRERDAREVAALVMANTARFDRIVLASMKSQRIVDVITG